MLLESCDTLTYHFNVPSGERRVWRKEIKADARIKNVRVVFPKGEEGDLKVTVYGEATDGTIFDVLNMIGDIPYLNGDGTEFDQDYDTMIRQYSEIVVDALNTDVNGNDYPAIVEIFIEYERSER